MPIALPQIPKQIPNSLLLIDASKEEALSLVKQILGKKHEPKLNSGNHPDLHYYQAEGKSGLHPIANIHQLIKEMSLPPFEAPRKVFILEDAEKMLPSASNALLKTLEEPNRDTYFLLMTHYPSKLLPTIRSRLYPLKFTSAELTATDLSPYLSLASQGQWDRLLDELPDDCPEDFLRSCLEWASKQKNPTFFKQVLALIETAEKALQHNLKPRVVFLNLLFHLNTNNSMI